MTRELIKELREWVAIYDRRGEIVMTGGTPPEIHFSERLRDTLSDAAETLTTRRNQTIDEAREVVAKWMISHSYPTGHGDTLEDLLLELAGAGGLR